MADIGNVGSSSPTPQAPAPQASNSPGAFAAAQEVAMSGSTKINSLESFKKEAPKVYDAMMFSITYGIIRDMREGEERRKKLNRQG